MARVARIVNCVRNIRNDYKFLPELIYDAVKCCFSFSFVRRHDVVGSFEADWSEGEREDEHTIDKRCRRFLMSSR